MSDRIRYVLALVVGLLAIPGLAFATSSVLSSDDSDETTEVMGIVATSTTNADSSAISAEDLVRACGVEGHYLVELEATSAIDDIQRAALNALRPICDEAVLPLPAAPVVEGETIVETVTVVRTIPGSAAAATKSTTTTSLADDPAHDATEALAVRQRALAAIDKAIAVGGKVDKINEAIALVERGDSAYEAADYHQAEDLYEEAEHKAFEAQQELEAPHDEDHDEDDDHDDYHEDEDDD